MMSRILQLALLFCSFCIHAELMNHLKAAPNKSADHSMPGIDFIYMINLDQRPEKFDFSKRQLALYGIEPYRFSAVNGWELTLEQINDIGLKYSPLMNGDFLGTSYLSEDFLPEHGLISNYGQAYFCHCMARGTIGIALSHISILKDAYDSGYETIWVMEDDIEVLQDPNKLSELIQELDDAVGKNNWDILFSDTDIRDSEGFHVSTCAAARRPDYDVFSSEHNYSEVTYINNTFKKVGARFGATSMIVRRSGMKKLLQFYMNHGIFLPYDMDYILPRGIKLYSLNEDIVSNLPKALSDNGGANYKNKPKGNL